ncbi:MAG: hypothetical protein HY975_04675 [Candidatus Kerfeldbacteria bacterium]|nr:hypothetical protein [Candidatus Kerfeldbacteria bacterium]
MDSTDEQNTNLETPEPSDQLLDSAELLPFIDQAQRALDSLRHLIDQRQIRLSAGAARARPVLPPTVDQEGARVIEGTFDGQNMVGPDGKQYSVPANYASKSKLVEGDVLKLTITKDGSFIYKQIGPIERQRLIGTLNRDEVTGEYRVVSGDITYKVLLASITYFKGEPGDDVVVLLPATGEARWAAVENIIKQGSPAPDLTQPIV